MRLLKRCSIPVVLLASTLALATAPAGATVLFNVRGGGTGRLLSGGTTAKVPIFFLCPKEENVDSGGKGVVVDVGLSQDTKSGVREGEAEAFPVKCTGKWKLIHVPVPIDPAEGPAFVKGRAVESVVLDDSGVDVASWGGKEGSVVILH